MGLLFDEEFLPFWQMGPVPLPRPSFLQGSVKAYSVVRREGGWVPPPPKRRLFHMPVWHNVLLKNSLPMSYWCPQLIKRGVLRWGDLVDNEAIPVQLWEILAPMWQPVYLRRVADTWSCMSRA